MSNELAGASSKSESESTVIKGGAMEADLTGTDAARLAFLTTVLIIGLTVDVWPLEEATCATGIEGPALVTGATIGS